MQQSPLHLKTRLWFHQQMRKQMHPPPVPIVLQVRCLFFEMSIIAYWFTTKACQINYGFITNACQISKQKCKNNLQCCLNWRFSFSHIFCCIRYASGVFAAQSLMALFKWMYVFYGLDSESSSKVFFTNAVRSIQTLRSTFHSFKILSQSCT